MDNWFAPGFDPAKAAWEKGQAPFGQYEGKLVTDPKLRGRFSSPEPMRTLWDKEVLLVRGTFQLPLPKPGYLYRIVVSTGLFGGKSLLVRSGRVNARFTFTFDFT